MKDVSILPIVILLGRLRSKALKRSSREKSLSKDLLQHRPLRMSSRKKFSQNLFSIARPVLRASTEEDLPEGVIWKESSIFPKVFFFVRHRSKFSMEVVLSKGLLEKKTSPKDFLGRRSLRRSSRNKKGNTPFSIKEDPQMVFHGRLARRRFSGSSNREPIRILWEEDL